jgi:4,5-dihydroxyphthalate decarboxylase
MAVPKVRFASNLYDRMQALHTGEVQAEGVDLQFTPVESAREIFDRMAARQEFDAAEFSSSEFISRLDAGQCPFVAIPVFPSRTFRHSFVWYNARSGIMSPKDLAGRRIGVPLYTMTAAIWIRGHLERDFGVDLSGVKWVQGAINQPGPHGDPTVMPLLKPVPIEQSAGGKSLSDLLDEGKIDALIGTNHPDSRYRNPDIRRLFPDFKEVEKDYYKRTGVFPIMHLVAIRKDVYERNPEIAKGLYEAFCKSKNIALKRMRHLGAPRYMLPWLSSALDEVDEVFGADPWPYGIERNRATIETLAQYLSDQSLIRAPKRAEEIFVPVNSSLQ